MACGYSSCGYSSAQSYSGSAAKYSSLESAVADYTPVMRASEEAPVQAMEFAQPSGNAYLAKKNQMYAGGMYLSPKSAKQYFSPDAFLNDTPTEFIKCSDEHQKQIVKSFVEQAFEATTGKPAPKDIAIRICSLKELKKLHEQNGGKWSSGIRGFSINRRGFGTSQVFVREDELARLMLTIGHEIGHVISLPMKDPVDEEAKAFAFSMAWMSAIKENNIGELSEAISPMPARNGLHNVAFDFVVDLVRNGRKAIDVYLELIRGGISISNKVPVPAY